MCTLSTSTHRTASVRPQSDCINTNKCGEIAHNSTNIAQFTLKNRVVCSLSIAKPTAAMKLNYHIRVYA